MHSREIIKLLEKDGWYLVATQGSHHQFKHKAKPGAGDGAAPQAGYSTGNL